MALAYKIIRLSAWFLVLTALVFVFSGFLMTKNYLFPWITYQQAHNIHTNIVSILFIILFFIHALCGLYIMTVRYKMLNNKVVRIIFTLIWIGIFSTFLYLYFAKNPNTTLNLGTTNNTPSSQATTGITGPVTLSTAELAKHNSTGNCWLLINNNIYNVTNFINSHPGGVQAIANYCGKDATQAYATKNIGVPHSSNANSILASYLLGTVGQTINGQQIQNVQNQTPPANTGRGDD